MVRSGAEMLVLPSSALTRSSTFRTMILRRITPYTLYVSTPIFSISASCIICSV